MLLCSNMDFILSFLPLKTLCFVFVFNDFVYNNQK